MRPVENNIFTIFDEVLQRRDKEVLLNQRSKAIWLTGLSGSGKTTIAKILEQRLHKLGYMTQLLDGDNIRVGICNNLDFSEAGRLENIRRISEVTKLYLNSGVITINCFVSPTIAVRAMAKKLIGADDFVEVYVNTSLEACEARDVKGLYKKARAGEIKDFTGISAPFEAPEDPALDLMTESRTPEECAEELYRHIEQKIIR